MKKSYIFITAILFFFIGTKTYANIEELISKFPVKLYFNGESKTLSDNYEVYNINGSAYVPIRSIVNQLGGTLSYDQNTKSIFVNYPMTSEKHSSISSSKAVGGFTVELHSKKDIYEQNEFIDVWSTLSYQGEQDEILVEHGMPLLSFYIKDKNGLITGGYRTASATLVDMKRGNQFLNNLPLHTIIEYNYKLSGFRDYGNFLKSSDKLGYLPSGSYTVGVNVNLAKGKGYGNQLTINNEIEIKVK